MAAMTDGSGLHIYENVHLNGQLRNVLFEADLLVCHISDDAILGTKFLSHQDCSVESAQGLLVIAGKAFQCTDRTDLLLANKVQVMRTLTLLPDQEAAD